MLVWVDQNVEKPHSSQMRQNLAGLCAQLTKVTEQNASISLEMHPQLERGMDAFCETFVEVSITVDGQLHALLKQIRQLRGHRE